MDKYWTNVNTERVKLHDMTLKSSDGVMFYVTVVQADLGASRIFGTHFYPTYCIHQIPESGSA